MKINLNSQELRMLLEMLFLSSWVLDRSGSDDILIDIDYDVLKQKLLSIYYHRIGEDDFVEYSDEDDEYFECAIQTEPLVEDVIERYNNRTFWDELLTRLSRRDVINEIGKKQYEQMGFLERLEKLEKKRDLYCKEFEALDLERLQLPSKPKKLIH